MSHEYRTRTTKGDEEYSSPITTNPKVAGENYRTRKQNLAPGETLELQKRAINPWETVEKIS